MTRANLQQANVPGSVLPASAYDLVVSLGVIEHFADPWPAPEQHVRLTAPGGTLVLEMPNYTRWNRWLLQRGSHQLLEAHNTRIMHLPFLREVAARFGLTPRFTGYIGGFEPGLWDGTGQRFLLRQGVRAASLARRTFRFFDRVNHPFFSGYLMGTYQKPEAV